MAVLLVPGLRICAGSFVVGAPLGTDALGGAYCATDDAGRDVCVRVINLEALVAYELAPSVKDAETAVQDEAELLEEFAHARVARIRARAIESLETVSRASVPCAIFVADFVAHESLEERIASGRVSTEEAVLWARDLAEVLAFAHTDSPARVHSDVRPASVRVGRDGHAVLADWTGSWAVLAPARVAQPTRPALVGHPWYFSPERAAGGRFFRKDDAWAWGLVALQLVLGRRREELVPGESAAGDLRGLARGVLAAKERHPGLGCLIEDALRVSKEARPSASSIAARLQEGVGSASSASAPADSLGAGGGGHVGDA